MPYRSLAELSSESILVIADGRYVFANRAATDLLGADSSKELLGRSPFDFVEPECHELLRERLGAVLAEQRSSTRLEYHWVRLDGSRVNVEAIGGPVQWEGRAAIQVVAHEVVEREPGERDLSNESALMDELEAMRRLHELVARLLSSPDLKTALHQILTAAMRITGANMGHVQLLDPDTSALKLMAHHGFDVELLSNFDMVTAKDETACGRAMHSLERAIMTDAQEETAYEPYRAVAVAAGFRGVQSTPLVGLDGELLGMMSTHYCHPYQPSDKDLRLLDLYARQAADFVDRRRAHDALRQSKERLADENRHKDEYLAMLGHELRNPLGAIRHATSLLRLAQGDEFANERVRRAYDVVERQSKHMSRILDGLLDVSRIARGKIHLRLEVIDLRNVIEKVLEVLTPSATARGLSIETDVGDAPLNVNGDEARLAQVFTNIVGNAIKFTEAPGKIHIGFHQRNSTVAIRIEDTGVGIRPEMLLRIFEAFRQETQDSARTSGGLGLGLALAKGLVELHGGTITARSGGIGTGTVFEVSLPLTRAPAEKIRDPAGGVRARRVLIVEDNADAAEMLKQLLELRGHRVTVAGSGTEALDFLRSRSAEELDIVLCDIGLPGMSGYEVARAIRGNLGLRGLPLVAVTGYGQPEDRKRTAQAGFDGHLVKPVDLQTIDETLARVSA